MESLEHRYVLQLKPREKQELSFSLTKAPSLFELRVRMLEAGIPGKLKILLEAREPFLRELGRQCEILLEAPGQYFLIFENAEDFEQEVEVIMNLRHARVLREARYIFEERLGRRTLLVSIGGKRYVYKILPLHEEERREVLKSLVLWSQLSSEGIPKLVEVNLSENFYIAEYADGLNLEDFDRKQSQSGTSSRESLRVVLEIVLKALEILEYTYMEKVVHGDLKPSNIIYHENEKRVYIIDWETCRQVNEPLSVRGPLSPPEVVKSGVVSDRSDIYSIGATLSWLLRWSGDKFSYHNVPRMLEGVDRETCNNLSELIKEMTEQEPSKRPTPSEAKDKVEMILKSL